MFTRVCKEDTVFEGEMRLVIADSHVIILAWAFGGEIKGFQGVCPHTNAPLETADFDGEVLTCPLHNWTWDSRTGDPIHPPRKAGWRNIRSRSRTASSISTRTASRPCSPSAERAAAVRASIGLVSDPDEV